MFHKISLFFLVIVSLFSDSLFSECLSIKGKEAYVFLDLSDKIIVWFDGRFIMIDQWHSIDCVPYFQCDLVDIEIMDKSSCPYKKP